MNDWAELDRALDAMAASGSAEVREDGEWLAELAALHCELRHEGKNPLVHLWSDERNLTRRILRVREQSPDRIVLEVRRFGRAKPGRLEFLRTDSPRPPDASRASNFAPACGASSPNISRCDDRIPHRRARSGTLAFPAYTCAGACTKARAHGPCWRSRRGESAAAIEGILRFRNLVARLDAPSRRERRAIEGLRLFVPEGTSRSAARARLRALLRARVEVFEFREPDGRIRENGSRRRGKCRKLARARREVESALRGGARGASRVSIRWLCTCRRRASEIGTASGAGNERSALLLSRPGIRALVERGHSFLVSAIRASGSPTQPNPRSSG